jgi:hypothetical protein
MKRIIIALTASMLISGIVFIGLGNGKTKTVKEGGILSVNDISADPTAFKGTITITGVVAQISNKDNVFAIVDTSEAKHCKSTGCARFYLPVQYEGKLPKEWDEVNITGSFAQGGKLFQATKVEVLRHLTFQ